MRHARFRDPSGAVRRSEWHGDSVSFAGETYDLSEGVGTLEHAVVQ